MINPTLAEAIDDLALVDHHVHGVLRVDLDRDEFEDVITESDRPRRSGTTNFDSQFGLAVRKYCSPLLGLEAFASPEHYVDQRAALGVAEVNRRLLRAAGLGAMIIDTGFAGSKVTDIRETAELSGVAAYEIVRLEAVAEQVVRDGSTAEGFADLVRGVLTDAKSRGAIGTKSIAAYRYGLDLDPTRPSEHDLLVAVGRWLGECESSGRVRLEEPTILRFLLWCGVDLGLPLQIHIGYGDSDINLLRSNPALLTDFLKATEHSGTAVMLLHCYPYHREAAYLTQMFPHVFFDIGEAINYAGLQSRQIIRESLEIAPFTKQLYSSDGWGASELHYIGAVLWRRGMTEVLSEWVAADECTLADAIRVARLIGVDNAVAAYGISPVH
jgi:hypothetical protein